MVQELIAEMEQVAREAAESASAPEEVPAPAPDAAFASGSAAPSPKVQQRVVKLPDGVRQRLLGHYQQQQQATVRFNEVLAVALEAMGVTSFYKLVDNNLDTGEVTLVVVEQNAPAPAPAQESRQQRRAQQRQRARG